MRHRRDDPVQLARAREMRRDPTKAEEELWQALRGRTLGVRFRRQEPIGPFIVDFVCHEKKIVIEVDGPHGHDNVADIHRSDYLRGLGYTIVRFDNDYVLTELDHVLDYIAEALAQAPTPKRHRSTKKPPPN